MKYIIDNEFAKDRSWDLQTVLKWIVVGVLGCLAFQSLDVLMHKILIRLIEIQGIFGGNTSFLLSEIIIGILSLIILYSVVQNFKKRYAQDKINIQKILIRLAIFYVTITVFHEVLGSIIDVFFYDSPETMGSDPLAGNHTLIRLFLILEIFLKNGLAIWILLKR